jgi:hypothetical protein
VRHPAFRLLFSKMLNLGDIQIIGLKQLFFEKFTIESHKIDLFAKELGFRNKIFVW